MVQSAVITGIGTTSVAWARRGWRAAVTAVASLAMMTAAPALVMAATTADSPRGLAVSIPAEPTPAPKGTTVRIPIRVVNPGTEPVTFTIAQRAVLLGDNGSVSIGAAADPQWGSLVTFAPPTASVGARQFANVDLVVQVPAGIGSDLHFVGFLVTPVANAAGQVTVINQIGSFVTLDVPGPRQARLAATLTIPSFTIAREAQGSLQVANIGTSAVRFWGENDASSWPGGAAPDQQRLDTSLAPVSTTRTIPVTARPDWPVGFVTVQGQIVYPSETGSTTTEVAFSKQVFVIELWVIIAVAVLLLGGIVLLAVRGRRRRLRRPSAAVRTPEPAASVR